MKRDDENSTQYWVRLIQEDAREKAIDECAKIAEGQVQTFLSPQYAANQPHGSVCERFACEEVAKAIRALKSVSQTDTAWQPIETAPNDEMFIWAAPKSNGKWGLGLAYPNVSGKWSDAYGDQAAPREATLWAPLPDPPSLFSQTKRAEQ